ncbi:MAG: PAS domain-containing protein, partial [Calditrichaeota bacterium]
MKQGHRPAFQKKTQKMALLNSKKVFSKNLKPIGRQQDFASLTNIMDNLSLPMAILDGGFRLVYGNPSFSDLLGIYPQLDPQPIRFDEVFEGYPTKKSGQAWIQQLLKSNNCEGLFSPLQPGQPPKIYRVRFCRVQTGGVWLAVFMDVTLDKLRLEWLNGRTDRAYQFMNLILS